jgi:hypothetical protein
MIVMQEFRVQIPNGAIQLLWLHLLVYQLIFENVPQNLSPQKQAKLVSVNSYWNEIPRFELVFMKMLIFKPKSASLNTTTAL